MDLSEMQTRTAELEQQISALPAGSITKKTVNGKDYFYHRWTENKKRREKYIPADELENFRAQIERRKALEQELGVEIVLRSRQGIRFTPAGEQVLLHSAAAAREMEKMRRQLAAIQGEACGTLRAGISVNFSYYRLP